MESKACHSLRQIGSTYALPHKLGHSSSGAVRHDRASAAPLWSGRTSQLFILPWRGSGIRSCPLAWPFVALRGRENLAPHPLSRPLSRPLLHLGSAARFVFSANLGIGLRLGARGALSADSSARMSHITSRLVRRLPSQNPASAWALEQVAVAYGAALERARRRRRRAGRSPPGPPLPDLCRLGGTRGRSLIAAAPSRVCRSPGPGPAGRVWSGERRIVTRSPSTLLRSATSGGVRARWPSAAPFAGGAVALRGAWTEAGQGRGHDLDQGERAPIGSRLPGVQVAERRPR